MRGALPHPRKPTPQHHGPEKDRPPTPRHGQLSGSPVTSCALRLAPLVFLHLASFDNAEWAEIDVEAKEWRIPGHKMKMRVQHIVPLSKQAYAIIEELRPLTGHGRMASAQCAGEPSTLC